jgi:hypothetical protein
VNVWRAWNCLIADLKIVLNNWIADSSHQFVCWHHSFACFGEGVTGSNLSPKINYCKINFKTHPVLCYHVYRRTPILTHMKWKHQTCFMTMPLCLHERDLTRFYIEAFVGSELCSSVWWESVAVSSSQNILRIIIHVCALEQ